MMAEDDDLDLNSLDDDELVKQMHDDLYDGLKEEIEEGVHIRSEEHTSELQSLMRISYAVFCLQKKKRRSTDITTIQSTRYHHTSSRHDPSRSQTTDKVTLHQNRHTT